MIRSTIRMVSLVLFCALLGACSGYSDIETVSAVGRSAPVSQSAAESRPPDFADLAYAPAMPEGSSGHLMDVYLPDSADGPLPVVIWSAGSAWQRDDGKNRAEWLVANLVPQGYAVVAVSVRSSSQARFPAQLHDIKAAIRYVRANADRFGIDPDRIAMMGTSSGGWLSAMAGVTGGIAEFEGEIGTLGQSSEIQAVVAFWPPTHFSTMDAWMIEPCEQIERGGKLGFCHDEPDSPESSLLGCPVQECEALVRRASPQTYVNSSSPPIMIVHGQSDQFVPHNQGEALYQAYSQACATATFVSIPRVIHGQFPAVLLDSELTQGASIRSTSSNGCVIATPTPIGFSEDVVTEFLQLNLQQ